MMAMAMSGAESSGRQRLETQMGFEPLVFYLYLHSTAVIILYCISFSVALIKEMILLIFWKFTILTVTFRTCQLSELVWLAHYERKKKLKKIAGILTGLADFSTCQLSEVVPGVTSNMSKH